VLVLALSACSSSTDPVEPSLRIYTDVESPTVQSSVSGPGSEVQGFGIDSLRVDSVRILFSRLILHKSNADTMPKSRNTKAGPLVMTWSRTGVQRNIGADIEAGVYRKMKMEMHSFSGSEAQTYASDPAFKDFADPDRFTIIVDGTVFEGGSGQPFRLTSKQKANLFVLFDPDLVIQEEGTAEMVLAFDAVAVFKASGSLFDPRTPAGKAIFDARFPNMFKFRKK